MATDPNPFQQKLAAMQAAKSGGPSSSGGGGTPPPFLKHKKKHKGASNQDKMAALRARMSAKKGK